MTHRVGIIGYPLAHSVSPAMQQAAIDHCSLDAAYEAWETPPDSLGELLGWLRETPHAWGANVTIPHKEAVFRLVDWKDRTAVAAGAVNTVVAREGRLAGYNTDVTGFARALEQDAGFDVRGKRVLLLGAGGAARAVVAALAGSKAAGVSIANRTLPRAEAVAALARSWGLPARPLLLDDPGPAPGARRPALGPHRERHQHGHAPLARRARPGDGRGPHPRRLPGMRLGVQSICDPFAGGRQGGGRADPPRAPHAGVPGRRGLHPLDGA